jgi:hypothetical protein
MQVFLVRSAGAPFLAHRSGANTGVILHINPAKQEAEDIAVMQVCSCTSIMST